MKIPIFNPALMFVSALFFLSSSAIFYSVLWLLIAAGLQNQSRFTPRIRKNILFISLLVPPVSMGVLAFGGVTLHHRHYPVTDHHGDLCREIFEWFVAHPHNIQIPGGRLLEGVAWLFVIGGLCLILRLFWATAALKRGLSVFEQAPSPQLKLAITNMQGILKVNSPTFFEANIPMGYSCLLGIRNVRCILSRDLVAQASLEELEAVVAHEVNHLRAGDVWATMVVSVLNCLFFFLRPVRLISRHWCEETELACDEAAVGITGKPLPLATAILRAQGVQVSAKPLPTIALAFAQEEACAAEKRIERLLTIAQKSASLPVKPRFGIWQWTVTGLLSAVGAVVIMSPQMLCVVHCSLEAIARTLR